MAEVLVSPGVSARENDQSFLTEGPVTVGAAIVGPTARGPVELPIVVTSYSDYVSRFGTTIESGSNDYSYLTTLAAESYFAQGGQSLLVTRIVSASSTWGYATASIYNTQTVTGGEYSTGSFTLAAAFVDNEEVRLTYGSTVYRFVASGNPVPSDDVDGKLYFFSTGSTADESATNLSASFASNISFIDLTTDGAGLFLSASATGDTYNGVTLSTGSSSDFSTQTTLGGGVNGEGTSVAFTLEALYKGDVFNNVGEILSNGSLASGSANNIRYEIVTRDTSSGYFSMVIRQGNDNTITPTTLETFTKLSLDPKDPYYISKIIGDQTYNYNPTENYIEISGSYRPGSRWVRVKSVDSPTPKYLDNAGNAKTQYTASIPVLGSGSEGGAFGGGEGSVLPAGRRANFYDRINSTDTQGLVGSDYNDMLSLLSNQDNYSYNLLLLPGLTNADHTQQITTGIQNAQSRGDNLVVVDPVGYGSTISNASAQAASRDSSYAAMYWPWLQTLDTSTGDLVWVPASTLMGGVFAQTDARAEPWFAPAGINRGGIATATQAERSLSQANRDTLYQDRINPIASFPGTGVVVYGQKTLQKSASALDRVNVRRLLITIKSYISQIAQNLVFEQNTEATRTNFLAQVNPYLETVQQRQGLYAFRVVMDDTNNTPDVIDRNQLVGQIFIQPTKTAEFIYLDFNILPTGATFPG